MKHVNMKNGKTALTVIGGLALWNMVGIGNLVCIAAAGACIYQVMNGKTKGKK